MGLYTMEAHMLTSEWLLAQDTPIHRAKGALTVGCNIQWIDHRYTEEEKPFPMGGGSRMLLSVTKDPEALVKRQRGFQLGRKTRK